MTCGLRSKDYCAKAGNLICNKRLRYKSTTDIRVTCGLSLERVSKSKGMHKRILVFLHKILRIAYNFRQYKINRSCGTANVILVEIKREKLLTISQLFSCGTNAVFMVTEGSTQPSHESLRTYKTQEDGSHVMTIENERTGSHTH